MKQDPLNTEAKHSFSRTVAVKYSVNAAIVLGYISYKIHGSKNERDDKKWYYGTVDDISKAYPYLKRTAVYEALKLLTGKNGVLVTGNYNRKKYDRTTWYAFKNKAASEMAEKKVIYFSVKEAYFLDVAKAVLLENLRSNLNKYRKDNPQYCLHPMSPTELAEILPYSRATIQRKLKELVDLDGELVSATDLDGRNPSSFGVFEEVEFDDTFQRFKLKNCLIPSKSVERLPQPRINNLESSNPNSAASNPNSEGSKPHDYTTLIDNH